jgi:hypothetical protein
MTYLSRSARTLSVVAALCGTLLYATHDATARPKLESTCGGGMPIAFVRACDAHAHQGYVPLRRQLSDGSCMNMCCQQDANGNISCVSDPNQIVGRTAASVPVKQPVANALASPNKPPVQKAPTAPSGVLPNSK